MIKLYQNDVCAEEHYSVVKNLIQDRIRNILNKGINRKKVPVTLRPSLIRYLNSLLIDSSLKTLIIAKPDSFSGIITMLRTSNPNFFIPVADENFVLRNIFINHCYDNAIFSKHEFIKRINIDTCPYCNRNYIYYLSKSREIKPQLDHFYPKSIYPFLGVSYYNLIPSCQTCNGFSAKEEKDPITENLINPYLIDSNNFRFTFKIRSMNFLNPLHDKTSVQVEFLYKIPEHLNVFKLDSFYEQHSDHVIELIIKSKVSYSKQYREYLKTYRGLSFNDSEIDRMILGNYSKEEELHKRPLAKLYCDIGKELGLIV